MIETLLQMLYHLYLETMQGCYGVEWGRIDQGWWDYLMSVGWYGLQDDGVEAIYSPHC